jgi:ABC-type transport system substrate-binding protein
MTIRRANWWKLVSLGVIAMSLAFSMTSSSRAQTVYELWFIGFSPATPPADSLELRQAIAYAVDRVAVAKAVAPHAKQTPHPAVAIQHPGLPGYNPSVRGYSYDPLKARELYSKSGWTAPITLFVGPGTSKMVEALHETVLESIRKALGGPVFIGRLVNFEALTRMAKSGTAPAYIFGWISDPQDFGYPSFALGLAHDVSSEPELSSLLERRDVNAVEQFMLDRALIVPLIYY